VISLFDLITKYSLGTKFRYHARLYRITISCLSTVLCCIDTISPTDCS